MRHTIFFVLLFVLGNVLLVWLHGSLFRSSVPFAAFASLGLHLAALIFFPYHKLFRAS